MPRTPLHITDHALLRYLERVQGVDVAAARAEMAAKLRIAEEFSGVCGVLSGGFSYRVRGRHVTTVIAVHPAKGKRKP